MLTILMVHGDQVLQAEMAKMACDNLNCRLIDQAGEALTLLENERIDLIIVDMNLPDCEALSFISQARAITPPTTTFLLMGSSDEYSLEKVLAAGADDFLRQPFTPMEFQNKVKRVLFELELKTKNLELSARQTTLNQRLHSLLALATDLTAELDVDRLFPLIIGKVTEVMKAERSSLYVIDWEKGELWTKVAEQVGEIRLPLGQGISGRVAETGEILNVADAWALPYFNRDFDIKHNFRTRSVLCLPVRNHRGERLGVLQVINKEGSTGFDRDDEMFLKGLASQVGVSLENSLLHEELKISFERSISTLSATVDARHPLTAGHSQRVTDYSLRIGRALGLEADALEVLKYAALLHDIGKIGIRDDVLLKNGPFTPEEREEMNTHPLKTRVILENFHFPKALREVPLIAACHHEKVNGQGYPYGLPGPETPCGSKIMALADVFDALTSRRDYPKYHLNETFKNDPMPLERAITILKKDAGSHFDPEVVQAFLNCLPEILRAYRGKHFTSDYVDPILKQFGDD